MLRRVIILIGAAVAALPGGLLAQSIKDLQTPREPLVLKSQGSFFIGGVKSEQTRAELGGLGPEGHTTVNQMYVRYMPDAGVLVPIVADVFVVNSRVG
jgi:hypothetical protein